VNECKLELLSVYLGYPVLGISVLGWEDDFQTRAFLHLEWNEARVRVSALWFEGAIEISR